MQRPDRPPALDALIAIGGRRPHAVIEASAGTGKTHTLEHLVIDLLLEGTPIGEILVATFTEKATLEMRRRIRDRIAALVAQGETRLRVALGDIERASISTIHSFCQRILTEHAFASGRLLEQRRLDAREAFAGAFVDAMRRGLARSSSTRALWLVALQHEPPARLEELLWRWSREVDHCRPELDIDAFRTALSRMPIASELDTSGRALLAAIPPGPPRLRARKDLELLAPIAELARSDADIDRLLGRSIEWAATIDLPELISRLGASSDAGSALQIIEAHASTPIAPMVHRVLPEIMRALAHRKRTTGSYDFDDLLVLLHDSLYRDDKLVQTLRARFRYALVDEFQDTDPIQWAIFRRVFFEAEGKALYLIGDPKQSIYGFRNADVHTYLSACEEVDARGGIRVPLVDCYRSTSRTIDAINMVLEADFFTGPNRYDHPVRCGRPELRAAEPGGEQVAPVVLFHMVAKDNLRAKSMRSGLADAIATEIRALKEGTVLVSDRAKPGELRALEWSDIFVLTRSSKEGLEIATSLRRHAIPHAFFKQDGLFETREAKDILDVLRALEDPTALTSRMRAWLTPFFGVPLDKLDACRSLPFDHPFVDRLVRWSALAREHRFAALFFAMLEQSGLARRLLFLFEGERELVNYQHVLELLLAHASRGRLGLREIVQHLAALTEGRAKTSEDEDIQRLESERAAVQLLTMHKAKGLEAEVVFLFGGMTERAANPTEPRRYHEGHERFAWLGRPSDEIAARVRDEERQEEERLLYVALTRARSRIYLPYIGASSPEQPLPDGMTSSFGRLNGAYRVLNDRLVGLSRLPLDAQLFERRFVPIVTARRSATDAPLSVGASSQRLALPTIRPGLFDELRSAARGLEITSYTKMKRAREPMPVVDEPSVLPSEMVREPYSNIEDPLPGGTAFGLFVHEILERVDFARVLELEDAAQLFSEFKTLFERSAQSHGVAPEVMELTAPLIWKTLRTPIRAGELTLERGFSQASRRLTELSFLHPIPENAHPKLGAPLELDSPIRVERGFVRGVIDLLFEHEGRSYVLDWKTDRLRSYATKALSEHVEQHYDIQARLYALGSSKLLRIASETEHAERFGGMVYVFARGVRERARGSTEGIHFARPSFATLTQWDEALRSNDSPWGYPLPARAGGRPSS